MSALTNFPSSYPCEDETVQKNSTDCSALRSLGLGPQTSQILLPLHRQQRLLLIVAALARGGQVPFCALPISTAPAGFSGLLVAAPLVRERDCRGRWCLGPPRRPPSTISEGFPLPTELPSRSAHEQRYASNRKVGVWPRRPPPHRSPLIYTRLDHLLSRRAHHAGPTPTDREPTADCRPAAWSVVTG